MNEEQARAFLKALDCKQIKRKDQHWFQASCPLAPYLHEKGTDQTPSFGLSIKAGEHSHFNCFACRSGSAEELVQVLQMYSHSDTTRYDFALAHKILTDEWEVLPLQEYAEFKPVEQVFEEWPALWLMSFKPVNHFEEALAYLTVKRGVTWEAIGKHDLRFDAVRQMIVFPYFNVAGKFAGAQGRSVLDEVEGWQKHYAYAWNGVRNSGLVWYNEPVLNLPGPVVVTEGQFDCLRVEQAYPKVVANLTAKPSLAKMKKLEFSDFMIQIPDRGKAGDESIHAYTKFCNSLGITYKCLHLDEGVKDPDEACVEYLADRLKEFL